jgi:hypothetical protein
MAYFECGTCRAHFYSAAKLDSLIDDMCPACGTRLEAVGEMLDVVGYRSIAPRRGRTGNGKRPLQRRPLPLA